MCFRLAFTPLEDSMLITRSQDQSSLAALLEKNDELGGIAEAERLYDMFTPLHALCFCYIHRTLNKCRYRHVARVQLEVLGSLHCSACLAMCVTAHCLLGFRFCYSVQTGTISPRSCWFTAVRSEMRLQICFEGRML